MVIETEQFESRTHDFGHGPVPAHRHPNGGGWVADSATVHEKVMVPETTSIGERASIGEWASIGVEASIGEWASIGPHVIENYVPHNPVPVIPNIDARILEEIGKQRNSLDMRRYHTCSTTHCQAGWAIHIAGEAGYALERECDSWLAGALIYQASRPGLAIPDFFASDSQAIKDMRQAAKQLEANI